jgi:AAHS family 4-hydroxybenzoate transporter-like MFS transporter
LRTKVTGLAGCGFMLGISCGGVLSAYLLESYGWAKVIILKYVELCLVDDV